MNSTCESNQKIRIGNQTSCHVPIEIPFSFALSNGFTAFEWFSDPGPSGWCEADADYSTRLKWREIGVERDLKFSVHAPFDADPTNGHGYAAIRKSIDFAADIQAETVNLHLFVEHSPSEFAQAVGALCHFAKDANVVLTLENTPSTAPEHFNAVFKALFTIPVARGQVGMCYDSGHANLCSETRNDYIKFIDQLDEHIPIVSWHAHENWGDRDSHLTIFTGPSGHNPVGLQMLIERLVARGFRGSIILEQWPTPPELLLAAANGIRRMFEAIPVLVPRS